MAPGSAPTAKRTYESTIRAQRARETRTAIVAGAADLFSQKGWAGTGMREVAQAAGVAIETVYSHFASKRALLEAVVDVAAVGDEQPLAVAERPEFVALGAGRRADRIAAASRLVTTIHARTARFAKVLREAAPADEQIDEMLRATRQRQRQDIDAGIELIIGRPPTALEGDEIWVLLSPEVYLLFVEETGWSTDRYQAWVAATLERLLPRA